MFDKEKFQEIKAITEKVGWYSHFGMSLEDILWLIENIEVLLEVIDDRTKDVLHQQKEIENWKELFFLLKSDWEKEENWQTNEWMIKARSMGIDI